MDIVNQMWPGLPVCPLLLAGIEQEQTAVAESFVRVRSRFDKRSRVLLRRTVKPLNAV